MTRECIKLAGPPAGRILPSAKTFKPCSVPTHSRPERSNESERTLMWERPSRTPYVVNCPARRRVKPPFEPIQMSPEASPVTATAQSSGRPLEVS